MTACCERPKPEIVIQKETEVVNVPVKVKFPEVACSIDKNATATEKIESIGKCLSNYREAIRIYNKDM